MPASQVSGATPLSLPPDALSRNDPQLLQIVSNVRDELNRRDIDRYGPRTWSHPRRKHLPSQLRDFSELSDRLHAQYVQDRLPQSRDGWRGASLDHETLRMRNLKKWGHPDAINLMRGLSDGLDVNLKVLMDEGGETREFYPRPVDDSRATIEIWYTPVSPGMESTVCTQSELTSIEGKLKRLGLRECLIAYSHESVFEAFSTGLQAAGVFRFAKKGAFRCCGPTIPTDREGFREMVYHFATRQRVAHRFDDSLELSAIDQWETEHDHRILRVMAKGFDVNVVVIASSGAIKRDRVTPFDPQKDTVYMVERFDDCGNPHYNTARLVDGLVDRRCSQDGCIYSESL